MISRVVRMIQLAIGITLFLVVSQTISMAQVEPIPPKRFDDWHSEPTFTLTTQAATVMNEVTSAGADPERWSKIAFQSLRDGNWEIYLASGAGTNEVRLTNAPTAETRPQLNRGATQVVFVSNQTNNTDIYRINSDGSGLLRLTTHSKIDTMPTWSPDGRQILFVSDRDGNAELYLMNADGSGQQRLTNHVANDTFPAWSPDGNQLVWVRTTTTGGALWLMNRDGSNARAIMNERPYAILQHPAWSPDGKTIAFDGTGNIRQRDYWSQLELVNSDGSNLRTLYGGMFNAQRDYWVGSWSLDGAKLSFSSLVYEQQNNQFVLIAIDSDQYLFNRYDNNTARFPFSNGVDLAPHWQTADIWSPTARLQSLPPMGKAGRLVVQWGATDKGPAGVAHYNVQYRAGVDGSWQNWFAQTAKQSALFGGTIGKQIFLRVQAADAAGNLGPWSSDTAAATQVYADDLQGTIVDQRGNPAGQAILQVAPSPLQAVAVNPQGEFQARLLQVGQHSLQAAATGFISTTFACCHQRVQPVQLYLHTGENLIRNGGFENDLTDWRFSTGASVAVTTSQPFVGHRQLIVGSPCTEPCRATPEPLPERFNTNDLWIDSQNNTHIIYASYNQGAIIYHRVRTNQGQWLPPTAISGVLTDSIGAVPRLVGDGQDNLYAIWAVGSATYYAQRLHGGAWSAPEVIANTLHFDMTSDENDRVYLAYIAPAPGGAQDAIYFRWRSATTDWQPPQLLFVQLTPSTIQFPRITVETDGLVHLLWEHVRLGTNTHAELWHYYGFADGSFGTMEKVVDQFGLRAAPIAMAVDQYRTLHLLWYEWRPTYYMYRTSDGRWSEPLVMPGAFHDGKFAVDRENNLHLVTIPEPSFEVKRYGSGYLYWRKQPGMDWTTPQYLFAQSKYQAVFGLDHNDRPHFIGSNTLSGTELYLTMPGQTQQTAYHAIEQTLTIPATMHQPTLAFLYKLNGSATGASSFNVTVSSPLTTSLPVTTPQGLTGVVPVTTTTVFSVNQSSAWQHGWADLSAWKNQTITMTFAISQAANDAYLRVYLDEVTVTSWQTPVAYAVAPTQIEAGVATTLIITGANFMATPTVKLNNIPLSAVTWISPAQLQVTLPATLPPAIYDLWVSNPDGQTTARVSALAVGKQLYLPVIGR